MNKYKCISCGKIEETDLNVKGLIYYCSRCVNMLVKNKIKVKTTLVEDKIENKNSIKDSKLFELVKDFDKNVYLFNIKKPPMSKNQLIVYEYFLENYKDKEIIFPDIIVELLESNLFINNKRKVGIKTIKNIIDRFEKLSILIKK